MEGLKQLLHTSTRGSDKFQGEPASIIGRGFMHGLNILSPLSLARFFLTQQLIYQSKIEKHSISLDIFVSDTSVV